MDYDGGEEGGRGGGKGEMVVVVYWVDDSEAWKSQGMVTTIGQSFGTTCFLIVKTVTTKQTTTTKTKAN